MMVKEKVEDNLPVLKNLNRCRLNQNSTDTVLHRPSFAACYCYSDVMCQHDKTYLTLLF